MVIKIDKINVDGIDIIEAVLEEYIDAIKEQMFTKESLLNQHNAIENSSSNEDFEDILKNENALINSYIDNVLLSFNKTLEDFKNMKEKRN